MHDDKTGGQLAEELSAAQGKLEEREAETGHRWLEGTLQEASPLSQLLLDALPTVAVLLRPNREIVASNKAGVKAGAVPGTRCFETWGHRREPCPWCLAPVALATGKAQHLEVEALGKVWDEHWIPMGSDLYLHFAFDITDRRRSSEALRESNQALQALIQASPLAIIATDRNDHVKLWNPAATRIFGWSEEEVLGLPNPIVPADQLQNYRALRERLLKGERLTNAEMRRQRKDGLLIDVSVSTAVMQDAAGNPSDLVAVIADITEHKRAEDALRESERRYRELADSLPETVFEIDAEGRLTFVNRAAYEHFGYEQEDFERGINVIDAMAPEFREKAMGNIERVLAGQSLEPQEYMAVRKDGSTFPVVICSSRIMSGGIPIGLRGFVVDITRRKQLEDQLLRAQRLETAGRIAGQVAHDFNNLLGPLVGYPDLIKEQLPKDHPAVTLCDLMQEAAQQMAEINEDMMALGRRGVVDRQPTDLNRVIELAVESIVNKPRSLVIDLDLARDLQPVSGSPAQFERLVLNLVFNAREAMQDAGHIIVKTETVYVDEPCGRHNPLEVGGCVKLSVSDTGPGIPPGIRGKIFDAFFTTKRSGTRRGSGLGLSIVQAIVEDHGGHLGLESEVGKGTAFSVYLPVCEDELEERASEEVRGGTETILIVDDDQLQRSVVKRLLQRLGYRVDVVPSGEKAVCCIKKQPVDLLILDMVMPEGIDGLETYRQVLEVRPGQRAIIMSGFAESERVWEAQSLGAGTYLRKPLKLEKLARAVREELDWAVSPEVVQQRLSRRLRDSG